MEKILAFIIRNNKLLSLLGSDKDPQFHQSFWYTVTGGVESQDKDLLDTVKREVKEETNLDIERIIDLNWILEYESLGYHCCEHVFVAYANDNDVILNEESIDYRWCDMEEFIDLITWYDNKNKLKDILEKYLQN